MKYRYTIAVLNIRSTFARAPKFWKLAPSYWNSNNLKVISQKGGTCFCGITGNVVEFTDMFDLGQQPDLTQGYFATCARRCGRTGIVGSTSTSFDLSEFFTFGRSALLFRITVTKLYRDGFTLPVVEHDLLSPRPRLLDKTIVLEGPKYTGRICCTPLAIVV